MDQGEMNFKKRELAIREAEVALKKEEQKIRDKELKLKEEDLEHKQTELRLKYACDYFGFHARQRTTMFNFFIVTVGLIINGAATGIRYEAPKLFMVGLFAVGAFLSLAFRFLDKRNVQLLETAEDVMRAIEEKKLYANADSARYHDNRLSFNSSTFPEITLSPIPLAVLWREECESLWHNSLKPLERSFSGDRRELFGKLASRVIWWKKHNFWIPFVQWIMVAVFSGAAVAALLQGEDWNKSRTTEVRITEVAKEVKVSVEHPKPSASQQASFQSKTSCTLPVKMVIDDFLIGKASLPAGATQQLQAAINHAKACPSQIIELLGFTDSTGSDRVNKLLSIERAESVRAFLHAQAVPNALITTTGELFSDGETPSRSSRAATRRVEIHFRETQ